MYGKGASHTHPDLSSGVELPVFCRTREIDRVELAFVDVRHRRVVLFLLQAFRSLHHVLHLTERGGDEEVDKVVVGTQIEVAIPK